MEGKFFRKPTKESASFDLTEEQETELKTSADEFKAMITAKEQEQLLKSAQLLARAKKVTQDRRSLFSTIGAAIGGSVMTAIEIYTDKEMSSAKDLAISAGKSIGATLAGGLAGYGTARTVEFAKKHDKKTNVEMVTINGHITTLLANCKESASSMAAHYEEDFGSFVDGNDNELRIYESIQRIDECDAELKALDMPEDKALYEKSVKAKGKAEEIIKTYNAGNPDGLSEERINEVRTAYTESLNIMSETKKRLDENKSKRTAVINKKNDAESVLKFAKNGMKYTIANREAKAKFKKLFYDFFINKQAELQMIQSNLRYDKEVLKLADQAIDSIFAQMQTVAGEYTKYAYDIRILEAQKASMSGKWDTKRMFGQSNDRTFMSAYFWKTFSIYSKPDDEKAEAKINEIKAAFESDKAAGDIGKYVRENCIGFTVDTIFEMTTEELDELDELLKPYYKAGGITDICNPVNEKNVIAAYKRFIKANHTDNNSDADMDALNDRISRVTHLMDRYKEFMRKEDDQNATTSKV